MASEKVVKEMFDLLCEWNTHKRDNNVTYDIWELWWKHGLHEHWMEYRKQQEK